jgi:hypothetical protein
VGSRQFAQHVAALRNSAHVTSTFPSLVGSFESRLGVGNRQHLGSVQRNTARRNTARCSSSQRIPNSAATAFARLLVGLSCHLASRRHASQHVTPRLMSSQRITLPSVVGLRAECGGYPHQLLQGCAAQVAAAPHFATHSISTNTCQASVAFGQLAVRRNHVVSHRSASWRPATHFIASQRPPFGAASPSFHYGRFRDAVTGIATTPRVAPIQHAAHGNTPQRTFHHTT